MGDREFGAFQRLILKQSGIVLSDHKRSLLCSRLIKRLRALSLPDFAAYYRYLQRQDASGVEMRELVNAVTTNKTEFYREPHHFEFLRKQVLEPLVATAQSAEQRRLRVWSAACSSGEEPYTICLTLAETLKPLESWDVRVLASDIDTSVLARAKQGRYPTQAARAVPPEIRRRWCHRVSQGEFEVDPRLRRLIAFRQINFVREPWPIRTTFDVIFCRNVMIYFGPDTQNRIYEHFHRLLAPGGYLIAGHSENLRSVAGLFEPLGQTIYQRRGGPEQQTSNRQPGAARPAQGQGQGQGVQPVSVPGAANLPRVATQAPRATPLEGRSDPAQAAIRLKPARGKTKQSLRPPSGASSAQAPLPRARIQSGELFSSREPTLVSTVLGSCVACCLHDPEARVGGMNHFMLPISTGSDHLSAVCFGANAMELLINELLQLGAQRQRLQASAFGASNVIGGLGPVGNVARENGRFIREYLEGEGIALIEEALDGKKALSVTFETHTGRSQVRPVGRQAAEVRKKERRYHQNVREGLVPLPSNVTLF